MKPVNLSMIAAPAVARTLVKAAVLSGVLMAVAPGIVLGQPIEKKGTTPYVTHFIFRPLMNIDIADLGTATSLEAIRLISLAALSSISCPTAKIPSGVRSDAAPA